MFLYCCLRHTVGSTDFFGMAQNLITTYKVVSMETLLKQSTMNSEQVRTIFIKILTFYQFIFKI